MYTYLYMCIHVDMGFYIVQELDLWTCRFQLKWKLGLCSGLSFFFSVGAELEQGLPNFESYVLRTGLGAFYTSG